MVVMSALEDRINRAFSRTTIGDRAKQFQLDALNELHRSDHVDDIAKGLEFSLNCPYITPMCICI